MMSRDSKVYLQQGTYAEKLRTRPGASQIESPEPDIRERRHQASLHILLEIDERHISIRKPNTSDQRDDSNIGITHRLTESFEICTNGQ